MRRKVVSAASLAIAVAALTLLAAELGFRALEGPLSIDAVELGHKRDSLVTGALGIAPHPYSVYRRPPPRGANALGFFDGEHAPVKDPGTPRIVCLGGSTTEGGNARGRRGSYPFFLERILETRTARDFEVINAGMAGWTSAEMLTTWFLTLQDLRPDVLVLHEGVNDVEPRLHEGFASDYSHWRRPVRPNDAGAITRALARASDLFVFLRTRGATQTITAATTHGSLDRSVVEGELPPATSLPFRRNMESIARSARSNGCEVVLVTMPTRPSPELGAFWQRGVDQHNQHLRDLSKEQGYQLADPARAWLDRPELLEQFSDMVHLEPPGNCAKAGLVADALADWVESLPTEGARRLDSRALALRRRSLTRNEAPASR